MPIKNNQGSDNIPLLRFPEFQGDWEKKKLGEVSEINPTNKNLPEKFIYIDLESVSNGELLKENEITIQNAPSRAQRILQANDVLFQMVRPYQKNNLFFDKKGTYVASTGYAQIRTEQNPKYLFQYLHFQTFVDRVIERCTGTSYPSINSTDLSNIEFSYPSIEEQTKIASFLTAVDEKIQALKKKHSLLEQYKKGVMQKLFSQELRFKDENGEEFAEWEKKKLGEIFYSEKGKGISKNKIVENGKYQCVLYGELYTKYNEVIFEVESKTNEEDGTKSMIGDLLIPSSTTTTGIDLANVTALNKSGVLLGGDITILRSNAQINNVFYAYYLSNYKKDEIASYAQGITIVHLYYSHIKEMVIDLPSHKEQTFIANFLSAIDEKIKQTQMQIEKMEVWKKGLLQKMFC